jgi:hypothetical protein
MQNHPVPPPLRPIASPENRVLRNRDLQLQGVSLRLDHALDNLPAMTENGEIDIVASQSIADHFNRDLVGFQREEALFRIATDGASQVDRATFDLVDRLILVLGVLTWVWNCPNGNDHNRNTGPVAGRVLHWIVRFGALTYGELYTLCGVVYGEKTCCYAIQRLKDDNYLVQRNLGRAQLLGLNDVVHTNIPTFGNRGDRDEAAFEVELAAGREVIRSRR